MAHRRPASVGDPDGPQPRNRASPQVRLLDLFCGAGGAAVGYHRAGFDEIVGVDIMPQPNYPFEFIQADLTTDDPVDPEFFDLIHASPPCQAFSTATRQPDTHPDLIATTRAMLTEYGMPYVIENVVGAPLRGYLMLCGSMFGLQVQRHRYFEISPDMALWSPGGCVHEWKEGRPWTVSGDMKGTIDDRFDHSFKPSLVRIPGLMGLPEGWSAYEYAQSIPPAYTEWIGQQFLAQS